MTASDVFVRDDTDELDDAYLLCPICGQEAGQLRELVWTPKGEKTGTETIQSKRGIKVVRKVRDPGVLMSDETVFVHRCDGKDTGLATVICTACEHGDHASCWVVIAEDGFSGRRCACRKKDCYTRWRTDGTNNMNRNPFCACGHYEYDHAAHNNAKNMGGCKMDGCDCIRMHDANQYDENVPCANCTCPPSEHTRYIKRLDPHAESETACNRFKCGCFRYVRPDPGTTCRCRHNKEEHTDLRGNPKRCDSPFGMGTTWCKCEVFSADPKW